jgi:uncharacterized membrane protein (UPF0182 family)
MGDRLIYKDTFTEALAELTGGAMPAAPAASETASTPAPATTKENTPSLAERLHALRDQSEQLTRELEKLEKDAGKK